MEIEEVNIRLVDNPKEPEAWEKEIGKKGAGGTYIFSDSSLLELGNVGRHALVVGTEGQEQEVECGIGEVAIVWDGEIVSMAEGLDKTRSMQEVKVLILADSKAAIIVVKKAGKVGRSRTRHLQRVVNTIV